MAILLKIKWVQQSDTADLCQRIRHIGGESGAFKWTHTHSQAIAFIERGLFHYYMQKDAGVLKVEVGSVPNGGKYLKTQIDGHDTSLLLNLPSLPPPITPETRTQS